MMIQHLEKKHWDLLKEKRDLEKKEKAGLAKPEDVQHCTNEARELVKQCVDESEGIVYVKERERLVDIIDEWTNFLFQKTGESSSPPLKPSPMGLTWVGMTWEKLQNACRVRAKEFVNKKIEERVFFPERSIQRNLVEGRILKFIESDRAAMALVGEVGVGKTFLLCQMAKKSLEDERMLILPYDSQDLVDRIHKLQPKVGKRLIDAVGQIIANDLGYTNITSLEKDLEFISHLLLERDAYLLICLDSLERFEEDWKAENFLVAINLIVERFAMLQRDIPKVKIMIISLDSSWKWIGAKNYCSPSHFFTDTERVKEVSEPIPWPVEGFSEQEFWDAYVKYTGCPPEEDLLKILHDICQNNPYLLSIAASLLQQSKEVTRMEVFNIFYGKRVLRGTQDTPIRKENFLARFMQAYNTNLDGVQPQDIDMNDQAFAMLCQEGILVQEMIQDPFTRIILKLKPKGLVEYLRERSSESKSNKE